MPNRTLEGQWLCLLLSLFDLGNNKSAHNNNPILQLNKANMPFIYFRYTKKTEGSKDMPPQKLWVVRMPHPFQQPIGPDAPRRVLNSHSLRKWTAHFFVCYHLPTVVLKSKNGTWKASWSESLLTKTKGSQIAFKHASHFLNAAERFLCALYETLVGGLIGVHFCGQTVMVTISNLSIEPQMVSAALCYCQ